MSDLKGLRKLLEEERRLLLSCNLAELPALVSRKELALHALTQSAAPYGPDLAALRRDLAANQTLFEAALKGIRAALARLETIRTVTGGLNAYNAQGETVRHGQKPHTIEHRA